MNSISILSWRKISQRKIHGGHTIGANGGGKEPDIHPELQSNWIELIKPLVYEPMMKMKFVS